MERKLTLLIDLDGTIAEYNGRWSDGKPIGAPLPGAVEAVNRLYEHFRIIIFTTRPREEAEEWLRSYGVHYDEYIQKPLSYLIVDDRCLQFTGKWNETLRAIGRFKPWYGTEESR